MPRINEECQATISKIEAIYPGRVALRPMEVAKILGISPRTVISAIERKYNSLPARNVGKGQKNKSYIIPIISLARWSAGMS